MGQLLADLRGLLPRVCRVPGARGRPNPGALKVVFYAPFSSAKETIIPCGGRMTMARMRQVYYVYETSGMARRWIRGSRTRSSWLWNHQNGVHPWSVSCSTALMREFMCEQIRKASGQLTKSRCSKRSWIQPDAVVSHPFPAAKPVGKYASIVPSKTQKLSSTKQKAEPIGGRGRRHRVLTSSR